MGDRANIVIQQERGEPRIFLYSHWGGSEMPALLKKGLLASRGRWGDPAYATRIIAREMGMGQGGETGFGIGLAPCDNEYPYLVVDFPSKTVKVEPADGDHGGQPSVSGFSVCAFAEYVEITFPEWDEKE